MSSSRRSARWWLGGLSATHELAERGVAGAVDEAKERLGGKARSFPVSTPEGGVVADNLVDTDETLLAATAGRRCRRRGRPGQSRSGESRR